ncbi:uncharacterized protein L3040_003187 [Drepanopeziza brunnea f. sp. 'multigermtubi']|uniref:Uncharacterized protein n=1 Tax=Marssonina brunnea f. sp. multigermtubi (strain MB_m1) TaxID=1072389 RepID=K1WEQ7_MARBU|nr:uncharacterized protein MBM_05966 [Drepanopeziza brunnea f. sp. 'multigermtubi' MB_m1]EKD15955.1 hypothetical protein MBM_05966 [Drepanopeziza brunnea f. sp. 'multigermtubi' MB_m1]KAJ5047360.1 hypothetical protein L3040_003187 [Drepanopeziza brunnea f. sp. 'multigermtubi']
MFTQWSSRKRERDDNDETITPGFNEHRAKRRISALPHRPSPKVIHNVLPNFSWGDNYTSQPAPPNITPAHSDSEEVAASAEPRSFFSHYSSPSNTITQDGAPSPFVSSYDTQQSTQSTQMSDAVMYSDDLEMLDAVHLSPGFHQSDPPPSISGRIPTPIHSSFAPFVRSEKVTVNRALDFKDDEGLVDRFRSGRRLPSPISEGETSPSVIVAGFSGMQMDAESSSQPDPEKETPTKKGHTRSKHSLRNWTGYGSELPGGGGMKRSFSMGYRADCEKCRMKVPGHFSHIITY